MSDCNIIRDLLPSYISGACHEDTRVFVEEHLEKCEGCRKEYELLRLCEEELLSIIRGLPGNYREVFILHALKGMGFKEIGKRFGKSESWGKMTYKRARGMIAERLGGDSNVGL